MKSTSLTPSFIPQKILKSVYTAGYCVYVGIRPFVHVIIVIVCVLLCICRYYVSTKHEQSMIQAMEEGDDAAVRRQVSGAVEAFKVELRNQGRIIYSS